MITVFQSTLDWPHMSQDFKLQSCEGCYINEQNSYNLKNEKNYY
jgi:hypothetical protein